MIPQACSQGEVQPCYWFRGLIPSEWTFTPAPQWTDEWSCHGLHHVVANCLPTGTSDNPTKVFGDASGGPDTMDPRLRRLALGIAVISKFNDIEAECSIAGGLAGARQVVARGELKVFRLCVFHLQGQDPVYY